MDIYNYIRIDERLATSGQPSVDKLEAVAREGFEVVVNLALHDDPRYSLPDEARSVASLGMTYIHIPVKFDAPTEADLLAFFDAMDKHAGKKLLVHFREQARDGVPGPLSRAAPELERRARFRSDAHRVGAEPGMVRVHLEDARAARVPAG